MVENDEDLLIGEDNDSDETSLRSTDREKIMGEWERQANHIFCGNEEAYLGAWQRTHIEAEEYSDQWNGSVSVWLEPRPEAAAEIKQWCAKSPMFAKFHAYNEGVRRKLRRIDNRFRGKTLEEIPDATGKRYLLSGIIPAGEISIVFGPRKGGKSAFWHKLALCVASDDGKFDDVPVAHGDVLYLTLDPGANVIQVKPRMIEVRQRLHLPPSKRLILDDTNPVFLDRDDHVEELLSKYPGPLALIVIDSFYRALSSGDPAQAGAVNRAFKNLQWIMEETGAAIGISHHSGRADETRPLGSIFLEAGASSLCRVARDFKTNKITLDVQWLKNDEPSDAPLTYLLDGPYLAPWKDAKEPADVVTRPEMLALVVPAPRPVREVRKLIEHLLLAKGDRAREKEWERIRKAWVRAGAVGQAEGMIWRKAT